ncbi:MAG: hypothetical protein Q8R92_13020, partial [Deltaproteobacteria bacterium]|nr:hypothetical protein [Deltaproteobacteria bacterium]
MARSRRAKNIPMPIVVVGSGAVAWVARGAYDKVARGAKRAAGGLKIDSRGARRAASFVRSKVKRNPVGVAATILRQLGGAGRLSAMIGAHTFLDHGDGLSFKLKLKGKRGAGNYVKVTLDPSDTYTVSFAQITRRGLDVTRTGEYSGVYASALRPTIEQHLGLYMSLGTMARKNPLILVNPRRKGSSIPNTPAWHRKMVREWNALLRALSVERPKRAYEIGYVRDRILEHQD